MSISIQPITSLDFQKYASIVCGYDWRELLEELKKNACAG